MYVTMLYFLSTFLNQRGGSSWKDAHPQVFPRHWHKFSINVRNLEKWTNFFKWDFMCPMWYNADDSNHRGYVTAHWEVTYNQVNLCCFSMILFKDKTQKEMRKQKNQAMMFCLQIWQLTKKSKKWTVSKNSVNSQTDSKGNYHSGVYLLWPSLVTKWPRLILDVSRERKHLTSHCPRMTAWCFSLRSPDGKKTRVFQAEDKKNATALKVLNSGTTSTGVPITEHLRKPDP